MENLLEIGKITKVHGIKGELCIDYNAESPELLCGTIYLIPAAQKGKVAPRPYKIAAMRRHNGRPLIKLEGVPDRTAAEFLRGYTVLVPESRFPELNEDEVYLRDLPGLTVLVPLEFTDQLSEPVKRLMRFEAENKADILAELELEGEYAVLGRIASVADVVGQEIWTITGPQEREVLFVATDDFVDAIDVDSGYAAIYPPDGLLDLYLA